MGNSLTGARLLIVHEDNGFRKSLAEQFGRLGMRVTSVATAAEAEDRVGRLGFDVCLIDLHLPGADGLVLLSRLKGCQPETEVIVLAADGSIEAAVAAMRAGACDYVTHPLRMPELELRVARACERARLTRRHRQWVERLRYESPRYQLVGSSPQMRRVLNLIEKVAPTEASVLVRGASGTGKELVAHALHVNSPRAEHPLVTVNCAALQETLLESELFGHEKGAFTGAVVSKPGLIDVAEHGTLFIDEVGEMAPGLQAKLLRVLEDGHYRRVGDTHERHADVRVIAATNQSLEDAIRTGRFREDIYYRLNVVTIELPTLRERPGDIPELVAHFLATRRLGPTPFELHPDALRALERYSWPGNVRELANVIERAQILAEGPVLTLDDLPECIASSAEVNTEQCDSQNLRVVEKQHVQEVLHQVQGNKLQAARVLGISRRALYRLISKHNLEVDD